MDPNRLPKVVAFDLDYTMWGDYIEFTTGPFKSNPNLLNTAVPRRGSPISFYPQIPQILNFLAENKVTICAASRTSATDSAQEALKHLLLPPPRNSSSADPKPAWSYFKVTEIYPSSKLRHFKAIHQKTGIPYSEMLFFDDEHRNFEVEQLGVTMILVPSRGTDQRLFEEGLAEWRKRRANAGN